MDAYLTPPELLRYFVNGGFQIRYYGEPDVAVTTNGSYDLTQINERTLQVVGVEVTCRSLGTNNASSGRAEYTMNLDPTGVPQTMVIKFSGMSGDAGNEELFPVGEPVTVTMAPNDATRAFQVNTTGTADFAPGAGGGDTVTGITYSILRAGSR